MQWAWGTYHFQRTTVLMTLYYLVGIMLYAVIECNMETVKYLGVTFKLNDNF